MTADVEDLMQVKYQSQMPHIKVAMTELPYSNFPPS